MNTSTNLFDTLTPLLERNNILTTAAEVQGMFCGMLGGGMPLECQDWLEPLADFIHQGEMFSKEDSGILAVAIVCKALILYFVARVPT